MGVQKGLMSRSACRSSRTLAAARSAGGPYALACAWRLPGQVRSPKFALRFSDCEVREPRAGGRWHAQPEYCPRFLVHPRTPESSDWSVGRMLGGLIRRKHANRLAESKHPVVRARKSVSITRPSGTLRCADLPRQFRLTHQGCQSKLTDMDIEKLSVNLSSDDPAIGLRASLALHRLAERVEANQVASPREKGWSWQQIGDALGVTRQSVHAKYHNESSRPPIPRHPSGSTP